MKHLETSIINTINRIADFEIRGRVTAVKGLMIEVGGMQGSLSIGEQCYIHATHEKILCEAVSFKTGHVLVMPYGSVEGISLGNAVEVISSSRYIYPTPEWRGRVINALGEPVDDLGPLPEGSKGYAIRGNPPSAHSRKRVGGKIDTGVRAINAFLSCCDGQRMGIFAGSGVGKSSVLSTITRGTDVDIAVVGLIGERGREAREFIEDDLGEEGLARSVIVVSTSDEPPLMRRQAAYMTMAVSEYFRDEGHSVLAMMDSVTRFAMAQREISLSIGEPPASKGYTPSVFAELPRLLERAGPGPENAGNITGLFTVLVDGDDTNEPIADAVRGILDGHIVLDRAIAERGRYPAVNILKSVSRMMPACNNQEQNELISKARGIISSYEDMAELIRLGAYKNGTDHKVDEAIYFYPKIEDFLRQLKGETTDINTSYHSLAKILGFPFEDVDYAQLLNDELMAQQEAMRNGGQLQQFEE